MILKLDLKETYNNFETSLITIDFIKKNLIHFKNNNIIKDEQLNLSLEELIKLINKYITYWNNEYINNKIIGGTNTELTIYTDKEIINYYFKNEYPYNYNEFLKSFKTMVGIYEQNRF